MGCFYCKKKIKGGRSDKRFCDDACRNSYHNKANGVSNNIIRKIKNALAKNRLIIKTLLAEDKDRANHKTLLELGYNFKYHTHIENKVKCCYDYGYYLEGKVYIFLCVNS